MKLTLDRLKRAYSYDPATGIFTRHVANASHASGTQGGYMTSQGYRNTYIDGRQYSCHRLAWFYVYGEWPTGEIDHINGVRDDNRIGNLRDVSQSVNQQNRRGATVASTTGFLGVIRHRDGKFQARIKLDKKNTHLGTFSTPKEASAAYLAAKLKHHIGYVRAGEKS